MLRRLFTMLLICCSAACFIVSFSNEEDPLMQKSEDILIQNITAEQKAMLIHIDEKPESFSRDNSMYLKNVENHMKNVFTVPYKRKWKEVNEGIKIDRRITLPEYISILSEAEDFTDIIQGIEAIHGPADYDYVSVNSGIDFKEYWLDDEGEICIRAFVGYFKYIMYENYITKEIDCGEFYVNYWRDKIVDE